MQWKTKNVKTGPGLSANPAFGLGPKAAPRPSHGQARKALDATVKAVVPRDDNVDENFWETAVDQFQKQTRVD